jgi:hypothetical protein
MACVERIAGYRILAIDGSKVNLPSSPEIGARFDPEGKRPGEGGAPQLLLSQCYDIVNGLIVDVAAAPGASCERRTAMGHLRHVGKSHLAQAIGYNALRMGFLVLYRSIFDLVREFLRDEAMAGEDRTLRRYLKPDLLIIDDMGLKQLPRNSAEYLFEVVMRRYENRSTIMTSNRPIEEWGKLLGDVPAAGAILDRFLHHAEVIPMQGRSNRLKERTTPSYERVENAP